MYSLLLAPTSLNDFIKITNDRLVFCGVWFFISIPGGQAGIFWAAAAFKLKLLLNNKRYELKGDFDSNYFHARAHFYAANYYFLNNVNKPNNSIIWLDNISCAQAKVETVSTFFCSRLLRARGNSLSWNPSLDLWLPS